MLQVFESQGVAFRDVLIDDSLPEHGSAKRKPGIGMVVSYLQDRTVDWRRSAMVGDRETDMAFARHLGVRGFQLRTPQFGGEWDWAGIAHALRSEEHTSELQSLMRLSYAVLSLKK